MLLQLSQFSPFPPLLSTPLPSSNPSPLSSCPWVVHISSSASPFPIMFLTSPCLFCTYQLCFLIPVHFPSFSSFPLSADNPPDDLHTYDSVSVMIVCLLYFCFCFIDSVVDSYGFVVILMFIVLIFFFLSKSI